ncbi:MAG TPA: bifunctional [glutamate--ammonia ligase]-adenylyl-L-tyrosine phosphorylase/[glutamate--ammonia-ligase] adenylyltransferase [Polyangia bacterium]|nr:bifunctional [glutamate--ammonia ligase]-adenylyl-L-tyrosine phosphorylase/[glutamate--ammonia-ligase] adenylyltransferase [Polyangia bacterium]
MGERAEPHLRPPHAREARRARFVERGGVLPPEGSLARALLEALCASGDFLPDLLAADVSALEALAHDPWLTAPKPPVELARAVEAETAGAADFADFKRRLRVARRREMLRMGARELGWGTTAEVARELAAFADACLDAAVRFCDAELRAELGAPVSDDPEAPPPRFVVMGMGKLGGEELNFSSDVDVIYFYSTDAGHVVKPGGGETSLHHYYAELSRRVTAALEEPTGEGIVFRVDLRLRPESRSGPLCNSLAAAESYYETFGRTWERQAWLRARPCAGDLALGEELLAMLDSFVYPRSAGPKMLDDVRALRAQFRDPADAGAGLGEGGGFDVKLGGGGIRDVELVVQTLQLLHGGKRRDIRERNTPRALPRLVVAGLLTDREARTLADAYRFWRQLEHRVMIATGAQRHLLPGDADERAELARGLGYSDVVAFDAEVGRARRAVEAIADTFADGGAGPLEEATRLLNPLLERATLERLLADHGFHEPEAAADALDLARARLPAAFVAEALSSPDPDRALLHFRDVALNGSPAVLALLAAEPQLLRVLGGLFGTSDRLSDLLVRHPAMWEPLLGGLGVRVRTSDELRELLAADLAAAIDDDPDGGEEAALRAVRRFQAQELLRVGTHDVAGSLDAGEVTGQLSLIAETCVAAAIELVWPALVKRLGAPGAGLTVLALGSLGAREMRYGSDLDLVFFYGNLDEDAADSSTGVSPGEWFGRASQRVIGALEALLEEGRLYQVDTGLRPSGAQGLLVTSARAFASYHEREAAGWERVALLRGRVIYSTETAERRERLEDMLRSIAFGKDFDEPRFRAELRDIRERIEKQRGKVPPGSRHVRFDQGGVMDIEFLVALGQLRHRADPAVRTTVTADVLDRLVALGWPATLRDDHAFLKRVALRLRLLHDRPQDVVSPRDLPPLARTFGLPPETLAAQIDAAMARVRAAFDREFASRPEG